MPKDTGEGDSGVTGRSWTVPTSTTSPSQATRDPWEQGGRRFTTRASCNGSRGQGHAKKRLQLVGRTGTGCGAAALTVGEGPGISGERRETSSFLPSGNSSPRSQLSVGAQRLRSSHVALETLISLTSGRAAGSQSRGCGRHEKGHRVCTFTKHALKKKRKRETKSRACTVDPANTHIGTATLLQHPGFGRLAPRNCL